MHLQTRKRGRTSNIKAIEAWGQVSADDNQMAKASRVRTVTQDDGIAGRANWVKEDGTAHEFVDWPGVRGLLKL